LLESLPPEFRQMQTSAPVAAIDRFGSVSSHRRLNRPYLKRQEATSQKLFRDAPHDPRK
jgi:hypothetical protein